MDWINKIIVKKRILLIIILCGFVFWGCSKVKFYSDGFFDGIKYFFEELFFSHKTPKTISKYIEINYNLEENDTCSIDLRKVLNVDYDTMYLFSGWTTEKEISKTINIPYQNDKTLHDNKCRIILTKDGKIVYEDVFYPECVYFSFQHNPTNERYKKESNPIFFVKKKEK